MFAELLANDGNRWIRWNVATHLKPNPVTQLIIQENNIDVAKSEILKIHLLVFDDIQTFWNFFHDMCKE